MIRASVRVGATAVPLQLVFLPLPFTDAIFQQVETLSLLNHHVPVVNWDALVLLKVYAGGPQDVLDARQILKVRQPSAIDLIRISNLAERLGIGEEWRAISTEHPKDR